MIHRFICRLLGHRFPAVRCYEENFYGCQVMVYRCPRCGEET